MIDYRHFDRSNIKVSSCFFFLTDTNVGSMHRNSILTLGLLQPRFEYGFGLSYTSFKYSDLTFQKVQRSGTNPSRYHTALSVTFKIHNVGSVDGHEVPQVRQNLPSISLLFDSEIFLITCVHGSPLAVSGIP